PIRDAQAGSAVEQVLGYLNFSSGAPDPQFLANLDRLFEQTAAEHSGLPVWLQVGRLLTDRLAELRNQSATFREADQAAAVLELVFDQALPAYRQFHSDLLIKRTDETSYRYFFMGHDCCAFMRR